MEYIRKVWNNFCKGGCWIAQIVEFHQGVIEVGYDRDIKALTALRIWQDNSCSLFLRTYRTRESGEIIGGVGWEAGKTENKPK